MKAGTKDNFESILALSADKYTEKETFTGNGKDFTCTISTAVQSSIIAKYQNCLSARQKALELQKSLDVVVPMEVVKANESLYTGWKEAGDGKASFPLTREEELLTATTVETFVTEPVFTWAEAVVFGRVNGAIALKIQKRVIDWLQSEGLIESKNE